MSDLIERQAAIDAILEQTVCATKRELVERCDTNISDENGWLGGVCIALDTIEDLPSAPPDLSSYSDKLWRNGYERGKAEAQPEIVHCKDCKWKHGSECVRFADVRPWPNDFCSRAERRTDGFR